MTERDIFIAVRQVQHPADRDAKLDELCAGDQDLRRRVVALLEEQVQLGSFMQHGHPSEATIDQPSTARAGDVIGTYKLLEQIGEGGMGDVWMAEQSEPIQRRVAVKVIKAGMDSKQVLARFDAERQALALMDHPNIAKVLDAGATTTGRPYFVMELVKGTPITKFCDEKKLNVRERLELFGDVCRAVQHAHQKGIIHRDIKPSNVLVAPYDGKPVVKVIDFGVAKATGQKLTDATLFTGFGAVVGTPEYMSPEQAEVNNQDIDTRSDIYSLGVLLYELLTGSTPLTKKRVRDAAFLEVLRVIREEEPPKPSTRLSSTEELPSISAQRHSEPAKLTKLVRGELDWIVMKALEKDRSRRYETANGFAMDVQRYLADESVQACPPSAGYRLRKFARRNKAGLGVAALVLLFLVSVGSGIGWAVRDRSAREAEAAKQQAERQAKVAGQVEMILSEVDRLEREQKWDEALNAARRAEAAVTGGEADAATAERVRSRLKDLEFIDRLEQIRMQRAMLVEGKFDDAGADREYARAFREYGVDLDELSVEKSIDQLKTRPALAIPLAAALDDWMYLRRFVPGNAAGGWRRLVAVARGIDPELLRDRLRSSWGKSVSEGQDELRRLAESIDIGAHHPVTLSKLALVLKRAKYSDLALRLLRKAQAVYPGDFWLNFNLANDLRNDKDHEGAVRFNTAAVSIRPNSAAAHTNLGVALRKLKKLDEAIACYRKAIELEPKNAIAYNNLGLALRGQKKLDEAIAAYRKAIELDPKDASPHANIGALLCDDLRDYDKAIECFHKAIHLDPNNASYHVSLGNALRGQRKLDQAVAAYRKATKLDPKFLDAYFSLGKLLLDQEKLDEAIDAFQKGIEIDPKNAAAHNELGIALRRQGKLDEAIAAYHKAIEIDPKFAFAYFNLGLVFDRQKKLDEAVAAYRGAIKANPNYATAHCNLGINLRQQGKLDEAITHYRKAIEIDPKDAKNHNNLGAALERQTKLTDAIAAYRKAIELDERNATAYRNLGNALRHQRKQDEAIAALKKAVALDVQSAPAHNDLAWLLATCADTKLRDPQQAVVLAKKAVELDSKNWALLNTLGAAFYRTGDWKAAIAALEKSMAMRKGGDSNDWFFLAMAHWQLGEKSKAREWYDRAAQWMDKNQPTNEELLRFRAEAAELLGIEKKKDKESDQKPK